MDRKYKHYSAVTARWYSTHCLPYFMDVKLFKSPTSADKHRWNISALHLSTTQTQQFVPLKGLKTWQCNSNIQLDTQKISSLLIGLSQLHSHSALRNICLLIVNNLYFIFWILWQQMGIKKFSLERGGLTQTAINNLYLNWQFVL
jgi:hypothetical protein